MFGIFVFSKYIFSEKITHTHPNFFIIFFGGGEGLVSTSGGGRGGDKPGGGGTLFLPNLDFSPLFFKFLI